MPKDLLLKTDDAAKALCISRADYIRQALVRATRKDEAKVEKESTRYADPDAAPKTTEQLSEDEKLLKKYGIID